MMTIQEQLLAQIGGIAPTHAIIAPQNSVLPYITYQRISNQVNNTLANGPSIDNTRMQIDIFASTYASAQTVAQAVTAAMKAWSVQNVKLLEYDLYESDVRVFRVLMDFSIWQ